MLNYLNVNLRKLGTPFALGSILLLAVIICAELYLVGMYERTQTLATVKARMQLASRVRSSAFTGHIDRLKRDAQFLSMVPPVHGMVRAINNHGVDAQDNTSGALWNERLKTIFTAFSKSNLGLTQIRFIGIANNGMELIRVDQKQGQPVIIPDYQLETKGDRDFFQAASTLQPNQVFVSDLDYKREHGQLKIPYVRTLRAVAPVFEGSGKLFGAIILNHDVSTDFAELTANLLPNFQIYLTNSRGDYLESPTQDRTFGFEFGQHWRWQDDFRFVSSDQGKPVALEDYATADGDIVHVIKTDIPLDSNDSNRYLTLRVVVPDEVISSAVTRMQITTFLTTLGILLVIVGVLYIYRRQKLHDARQEIAFKAHILELNRTLEIQAADRTAELLLAAKIAKLGIWSWNIVDDSLQWNDMMFDLYDQPKSLKDNGLNFEHWRTRVHPDDLSVTVNSLTAALDGLAVYEPVFRVVQQNGAIRHVRAEAYVERNEIGMAVKVTGINIDITEQLLLETDLRQSKERSEAASKAKSEFLANMSHEIRTPMNAIIGMLQLLQQTELDNWQADYVDKSHAAAHTLLGILNDVLDFSRLEAGKFMLDLHIFNIEKLLRNVAVITAANVAKKDIEILFDVDPAIPDWVIGDDLRLQQILINLTGNAIKFTEHGEIAISVQLVSIESDIIINFAIRDTGIGISPEHCEHIFQGFSQAEASTARRYGGSGLGLTISQRFVEMMGGKLSVKSTLGEGSTFYFTITVKPAPEMAGKIKPKIEMTSTTHALNCLIVDDNTSARQVISEMLTSFEWSVDTVANGPDALKLVGNLGDKKPYDVIFVDWRMQGMDGWETCQKLRALLPKDGSTILVMLTAHGLEMSAEEQEQMPTLLDGILVKPVTKSMLYDSVASGRTKRRPFMPMTSTKPIHQQQLTDISILIVEDNETNQQVARELLQNEGAKVVVVDRGQAGIDAVLAADPQFDVVLMDIQMPGMDGHTATRIIREKLGANSLPIIAITANAMQSDREAALDAGMNDHIGKPFELAQLISVILQHTSRSRAAGDVPNIMPVLPKSQAADDFDVSTALKRLGGNTKTYCIVLKGFIAEVAKYRQQFDEACRHHQRPEAIRLLHTLKGLAATAGAQRLSGLAEIAEKALKASSSEEPINDNHELWSVANLALETASEQLALFSDKKIPITNLKLLENQELRVQLESLLAMLLAADFDAERKFVRLRETSGTLFPKEFAKMGGYIDQLDLASAADVCTKLLEQMEQFAE